MNDFYGSKYHAPKRRSIDIERIALIRLAERLKAEHDRLQAACAAAISDDEEFDVLWAEAKGVFFAYRNVADLLGWQ